MWEIADETVEICSLNRNHKWVPSRDRRGYGMCFTMCKPRLYKGVGIRAERSAAERPGLARSLRVMEQVLESG